MIADLYFVLCFWCLHDGKLECSCGAWVCPGFAINTSRTDEINGGTSTSSVTSALV